jgi:hypothetical protein
MVGKHGFFTVATIFNVSLNGIEITHLPFLSYISHYAVIPSLLCKVRRQFATQRKFMQLHLAPHLAAVMAQNDGSIDTTDIQKIEKYYGLAVPAILGEAYATLRGSPLTHRERLSATFMGASTGLFDDFYDKKHLTDAYIKKLYTSPYQFRGQNDNERLFNLCVITALENAENKELVMENAGRVHAAQMASRLQHDKGLSDEVIRQITFDKGGYSVVFYMSVFQQHMPGADQKLFYNAGALLQLENDIFDVYKDAIAGIETLVTRAPHIKPLRALYMERWEKVKKFVFATGYSTEGKKAFLKILAAIVSRGLVCLAMLEKRQKENNGIFDPAAFSRKQLICDMENPVNLLRTLHYYATIC